MRKTLFFATVFFIFLNTVVQAQYRPTIHYPFPGKINSIHHAILNSSGTEGAGQENFTGQSGTGANIDVIYHKIFWRINPDSTVYIKGYVQTNFKTIVANVTTITFDLKSILIVDSVRFRGVKLAAGNITRTGNVLNIALGVTLANGFIDSVTIYYQGAPSSTGPGEVGYVKDIDANAGNYIYTLSESYEDRDWWPCKADMQDKIDSMDITVSVPWGPVAADTFWAASNGKLIDSTISGNSRYFTYKNRYPMASYLVCVCVARFNKYYRNVDINGTNVPVVYNIFKGKASYTTILSRMDSQNVALKKFSSKFGDYPFKSEKHGFYEGLGGAGGMEHQTFSGIASTSLTSLSTLAHELSHQWFGDNVTFASWNDLWLAEGFARYSESLFSEFVSNSPTSAYSSRNSAKTSALSNTTASVWIPNASCNSSALWNSAYGSIVYTRGAMVVSMLRAIAGDANFFEALTTYQTNLAGRSATTDSLKNIFNSVLKTDISQFFTDYVGGSGPATNPSGGIGNPIYSINWNSVAASNKLTIQVASQTKTGGSNVSYFNGPVVLHFTNAASGWTKDTTIVFYDWGGATPSLSYAGNGISEPIPGNILNYDLSFTPTNAFYDDSARTMTTGSMTKVGTLLGYTWTGATNSSWNTSTNWYNNTIAPSGAQVTIATTGSQPVLPGTITVGGLFMNTGTTLGIGSNTLIIAGPVSGAGTLIGSVNSNITITDSANTLNFNQTSAATRSLNNLTISSGSSAILGTALDIYGTLDVSIAKLDLAGKNLTLRSTATGTARIADLTGSSLSNATNVTVERYISDVGHRAWRLLSVAVTGSQTIKQAWQENGVLSANLGTNITSPLYNGSNGFDAGSGSSSILTHVQGGVSGPSWNSTLANTNSTLLSAFPGYMIFVRGDRNATSGNSLHDATVLRSNGTIHTGTLAPVTVSATGTGYTLVGNPYPSPIDFEAIASTANLNQSYYLWDPTLTGNYGVGGYRLVQRTAPNTYQQTPVVLGGPVVDPTIRYIHSGQAFFLKATGANANVVFTESSKASAVSIVNPIVQGGPNDPQLIANLMVVDANNMASLADGLRISFNDNNMAGISDDILKIGNFGENLSSFREGKSLIVENRPTITGNDTIFLRMTNTGIKNYRFQIGTIDFVQKNVNAQLLDNFLGTITPLDLTAINNIDFSVTADPASSSANRFKITLGLTAPLPMRFTGIKAYLLNQPSQQSGAAIEVEWKVSNQLNLQHYDIERSTNGTSFTVAATQAVLNANGSEAIYHWIDYYPVTGDNFYRIKSIGSGGEIKYSQVVKVNIEKVKSFINIYPNPVTSHMLNLQFTGMKKGIYDLRLINTLGQVVLMQQLIHNGGNASQSISISNNIKTGIYRLELIRPNNTLTVEKINIIE